MRRQRESSKTLKDLRRVSLNKALAEGRLDEFIEQAERDGMGPGDKDQFDRIIGEAIKRKPAVDRT